MSEKVKVIFMRPQGFDPWVYTPCESEAAGKFIVSAMNDSDMHEVWEFKLGEMTQKEIDESPEFEGW